MCNEQYYHKENRAMNKLKNYEANLIEMPSSDPYITYEISNNLVAPGDSSYLQARLEYFHNQH